MARHDNAAMKFLSVISRSPAWWWLLLVLGISMIAAALYYQHVLGEWPCVLCIHVRILFAALILVSLGALVFYRSSALRRFMFVLASLIAAALLQRSWMLLATERGWIEGECSVDMGLPVWFAIDKWLPDVFSAWTSCGYTPEIVAGITMAEMLLVLSLILLVLNSVFLYINFKSR